MSNKGLIFVRKLENKTILVAVVDSESVEKLETEAQHVGVIQTGDKVTTISILHIPYRDRRKEASGESIDGLLGKAIWQN